ncbi:hypothetical protein Hanom_Chr10g00923631 [Helianthus anomalus]
MLTSHLLLLVGLDNNITSWISHTSEHPPSFNLVNIKKTLVRLVNGAGDNFSGA